MEGVDTPDKSLLGITPRTFNYIFDTIATYDSQTEFLVRVSFLEIYKDDIFDLLSPDTKLRKKMEVKEHKDKGIFVKDLSIYNVKSSAEMSKILAVGQKARKVGATKMNEGSSRSHSILTITIESSQTDAVAGSTTYKVGKLNLVDLAGSERQKKTEAGGERLEEAKAINWSLTVLGNCIKALVTAGTNFIPYRDSKLTRLLQDSLGGNTKTVMIANIGPAMSNTEETISTLRYADRAKQIKNKPTVNEDSKDAMLRSMQDEITALKAALAAKAAGGTLTPEMLRLLSGAANNTTTSDNGETMIDINQLPTHMIEEKLVEKTIVQHTGITLEELKAKEQELESQYSTLSGEKRHELDAVKAEIAAKQSVASEYEAELAAHASTLSAEEQQVQKLKAMLEEKERILVTGSDKLAAATAQKHELEQVEAQLQQRRQRQQQIALELQHAEQYEFNMNQKYHSIQEELTSKTNGLRILYTKYTEKKDELVSVGQEWTNEYEDMKDTIRHLDKQLKLLNLCVSQYVPQRYVDVIAQHSLYDDVHDVWHIDAVELSGTQIVKANEGDVNDTVHYASLRRASQISQQNGGNASPFASKVRQRQPSAQMNGSRVLKQRDVNVGPYFSYSQLIETKPVKKRGK